MARVPLTAQLKAAITKLAPKEKDKLLFRLIALKPELAAQLEYLLLEGGETQDERRSDVRSEIDREMARMTYDAPREILWQLQRMSTAITIHVKTTKDKYGDVWLNFYMLDLMIERFGEKHATYSPIRQEKLNDYIIRRLLRILKQMVKLDPDYHMDFRSMRNRIGQIVASNPAFVRQAYHASFQIEWLTTTDSTPNILL
jgi:hypothetical protein